MLLSSMRSQSSSSAYPYWRRSWWRARIHTASGLKFCFLLCVAYHVNINICSLKRPHKVLLHWVLFVDIPAQSLVILHCRDQAQAVAKQEIAELQRKGKREGLDLTYLKNVILGGFESGELPAKSSMLPVLGRLLEFSPKELDRVRNPKRKA